MVLLSVHRDAGFLARAALELAPEAVCVTGAGDDANFTPPAGTHTYFGTEGLEQAFDEVPFDLLVNAVVGAAGLFPTYLALSRGRAVATANKESLVIGGSLLRRTAAAHQASLLPIDSEHSAIWQCLRAGARSEVDCVWLTASGGPFLRRPPETFDRITPEEALGHPTWKMGNKITVDSATMMNKGFEVIEAHWLFDLPSDRIRVVVHPQSIVHSAVAFRDGSVIAHMGVPDMRHPIAYALLQPDRLAGNVQPLPLDRLGDLRFEPPDANRFPALELARRALAMGDSACVALNAANEVGVAAFLEGRLKFTRIAQCVAAQLDEVGEEPLAELHDIYEVDQRFRRAARLWIERQSS